VAISRISLANLKEAALHQGRVDPISARSRSIHATYRYPARFSPEFAREAITAFTSPRELVVDPFCGGGTSAVEAMSLGRRVIANDLSPLAAFITDARTTLYQSGDFLAVERWMEECLSMKVWTAHSIVASRPKETFNLGVLDSPEHVKALLLAWESLAAEIEAGEKLARLILLRVGQRSLDLRQHLPNVEELRKTFIECAEATCHAVLDLGQDVKISWNMKVPAGAVKVVCGGAEDLLSKQSRRRIAADLLLFSPPYPGVHVLYQKWQVLGRRETPLPSVLAGVTGTTSENYYTMGDRDAETATEQYVDNYREVVIELKKMLKPGGVMVQMIGFSKPHEQLPLLLKVLRQCGFVEVRYKSLANGDDGRLWRGVPSLKWYSAVRSSATHSSKELVLIHKHA
jgi:DNA modification methylase